VSLAGKRPSWWRNFIRFAVAENADGRSQVKFDSLLHEAPYAHQRIIL